MLHSGKIYLTGIDPGSIVSSCRRRSRSGAMIGPNRSEPRPNIFNRRRVSDNLHQVAITLLARRQGYTQIYPTDVAGPTTCLQPPPQLDELLSTDTRDFEPGAVTPPKPSKILTPFGPLTRSSEDFSIIMIDLPILIFLCSCDLRIPFNFKMNATRCSYRLMLVP